MILHALAAFTIAGLWDNTTAAAYIRLNAAYDDVRARDLLGILAHR